jgi:hypothetical protein
MLQRAGSCIANEAEDQGDCEGKAHHFLRVFLTLLREENLMHVIGAEIDVDVFLFLLY